MAYISGYRTSRWTVASTIALSTPSMKTGWSLLLPLPGEMAVDIRILPCLSGFPDELILTK